MQDFSQRASAKTTTTTTTTNRLLPTSDHVSTSVHIYIPLEIIQKEERMVKINSSTRGGGGLTFTKKYYYITIDLPQKIIRIQNKFVDRTSRLFQQKKTITSKIYAFNMFKCIQPENNQFFPLPNVTFPLPNATSPPPPPPTTGTVLTHLESK